MMNNTPALNDNINLTIEAVERNYRLIKEFETSTRIKITNDKIIYSCDVLCDEQNMFNLK